MMLSNQNWIGFAGDPLTGKTPTQTLVHADAGVVLTGQQQGAVAHAYKLFCDAVTVSSFPGGYHVQNRTLTDGTKVRMTSISGVHQVHVWPTGGGESAKLPHGFAVVTNWTKPFIYGRPHLGSPPEWKAFPDPVPQALNEIVGHNQFFDPVNKLVIPWVHVKSSGGFRVWSFLASRARSVMEGVGIPFWIPRGSKAPAPHDVHFATIAGGEGRVMSVGFGDSPHIGVAGIPEFSPLETTVHLPAATTTDGKTLIFQFHKCAYLSPMSTVLRHKFKAVSVQRVAPDWNYGVVGEPSEATFDTPAASQQLIDFTADDTLGESATDHVYYMRISAVHNIGLHYGQWVGRRWHNQPLEGRILYWDPMWRVFTTGYSGYTETRYAPSGQITLTGRTAFRNISTPRGGAEDRVILNVLKLPMMDAVDSTKLTLHLEYPYTKFIRAGSETYGFNWSITSSYTGFGPTNATITRRDCKRWIEYEPTIDLLLPWRAPPSGGTTIPAPFYLLEGSVSGSFDGKLYTDMKYNGVRMLSGAYDITYPEYVTPNDTPGPTPDFPPVVEGEIFTSDSTYYTNALANNIKPYLLDIAANVGWHTTVVADASALNVLNYTFKSRYLIDYDHKGKFYAAIRVEVQCAGAKWEQAPGSARGITIQTSPPVYVVKIVFETQWGEVGAEQILIEETCTRPGFEFIEYRVANPFLWPAGQSSEYDVIMRMPPQPVFTEDAAKQLRIMATHQGVNPHIAVTDTYSSVEFSDAFYSARGIEYSSVSGGVVDPTRKFVFGQLYARTFKLSDLSDALWLLRDLKCDAPLNNIPEVGGEPAPLWHYMPGVKAALDVVRHIEVRDGIITNWSDDAPVGTGTPAADRQIKLYRV